MITETIDNITARAQAVNKEQDGDYINKADGFLYCGKCHTPKQCKIRFLGKEEIKPCTCACMQKEQAAERQRREDERISDIRKACFDGGSFTSATFDNDDGANKMLMRVCRKYSDKFSLSADWLLLHGGCGTGKSFAAACICNELVSRGFSARFVTISQIEKELFNAENKAYIIADLNGVDLLCLDDFGAERDTEYMRQIVFDLIDSRLKSGKPCVITTNLTPKDFSSPKSFEAKRVYSRLFEKAIPFEVKGNDRRLQKLQESGKARLAELLAD